MKKKSHKESIDARKPIAIVGIGASAGGLNAIKKLLSNLPVDTNMAFVYVQHLHPTSESALVPLLQRVTPMKVLQAVNGITPAANEIIIIPPNKEMILSSGKIKLSARPGQGGFLPIDRFLLSLAKEQLPIIGIILSGSLSDGALGLKAVKEAGGFTFAQDESAEFQSMPQSAIAEGMVDAIISPEAMAKEIERLSRLPHLMQSLIEYNEQPPPETSVAETGKNALDINPIIELIKAATGVDFTHYKENTIRRRIVRRMILTRFKKLPEYHSFLKENASEINLLFNDLLINVTHFFRDSEALDFYKAKILPALLNAKSLTNPLRVWIPACSTGEEAYSMAITILETLGSSAPSIGIQIFATDLSENAIARARMGLYSASEVMHVSAERLAKFFTKVNGHYRIVKSIRELCVFAAHNVFRDPPFSRIDLVTCCNLLIYLNATLQKKVISNFHYALNASGYLILGKAESVGNAEHLFKQVDKKTKLYGKKSDETSRSIFDSSYQIPDTEKSVLSFKRKKPQKEIIEPKNIDRVIDNLLLTQFAPAALVINHDMDILQFRGSTSVFLEPLPGKASLHLLKMARPGLALELRSAVQKTISSGLPVRRTGVHINYKNQVYDVSFEVLPLETSFENPLLMVVLEENRVLEVTATQTKDRRVKQVEAELIALREDMRSILDQQESANEELQSANEEIVSSNEELQSINEELETSKEEVESSNEELMTINQELQVRNQQLAESHEYTEAVIETIREAVLILDHNLRVKMANNAFYKIFRLQPKNVEGYFIYEVGNGAWMIAKLQELLEDILPKNTQIESFEMKHTFDGIGEKILMLSARRINQKSRKQSFILLAIEDITEHRHAKLLLQEREAWLRNMSDNVPVMIWVAGTDKNFTYLNKTWLAFTGKTLANEVGIGWTEGVHKNDLEKTLTIFHESFNKKEPFIAEYRMKRFDGEYKLVKNQAVPSFDANNIFTGYIGSCVEI